MAAAAAPPAAAGAARAASSMPTRLVVAHRRRVGRLRLLPGPARAGGAGADLRQRLAPAERRQPVPDLGDLAVGLNIVVGYAGLLDLGYVAFWAIGGYVAGWLMSPFFAQWNVQPVRRAAAGSEPGIHINFWLVLPIAAAFCASVGRHHRRARPCGSRATTWRW